jgi:hypothetical protein
MIALIGASALALLGLQATINVPRDAFRACLTKAADKATTDKVAADGIEAYLKTACTVDANALRGAVIAFDTKNGMAHKTAASDADSTVDDYVSSKVDHYKYVAEVNAPPAKSATPPATAPAVASVKPVTPAPTPAAVTTPPKP